MRPSTTDPRLLVHAYVDGELDPANALEVERRIAAEPALAAERDRVTALRTALSRHFPRESAPAALVGSSATYVALGPQEVATTQPKAASTQVAVLDAHIRAMMAPQAFDV